jgi:hypothetical protein
MCMQYVYVFMQSIDTHMVDFIKVIIVILQ